MGWNWIIRNDRSLLLGLHQYKASSLETAREREDQLRNLEGKSMQKGKFTISIENIEFEERSGVVYRIKRLALRPVDGTIYVTVTLQDIGVPEQLWEMDHADAFYDTLDFPVECVNSRITSSNTALVFELRTAEYVDLK